MAFFQAGGQPETVIDLLTTNYHGYGQLANLIGSWLADAESLDSMPSVSTQADFKKLKEDDTKQVFGNATSKIELSLN